MIDSVTLAILRTLEAPEMVVLYNGLPGARQVTRFSDRTTASKRLEMALDAAGMRLSRVEGVVFAHAPGAEIGRRLITVLAGKNPKRVGSDSHLRFALYRTGMPLKAYLDAVVALGYSRQKARKDIYWDVEHGYISVSE